MANEVVYSLKDQTITQLKVPDELNKLYEYFWKVSWDVPVNSSREQQILTEPKADIYIEENKKQWKLSPIRKSIFKYKIEGKGAVFGIKLRPATQYLYLNDKINLQNVIYNSDFNVLSKNVLKALYKHKYQITEDMKLINDIIDLIYSNKELNCVDEIIETFDINPRKLQRLFKRRVGLSVKWIICRYRLLESLKKTKGDFSGWSELAMNAGYSDQAHFIREFKNSIGLTPSEYLKIYQESL